MKLVEHLGKIVKDANCMTDVAFGRAATNWIPRSFPEKLRKELRYEEFKYEPAKTYLNPCMADTKNMGNQECNTG